MLKIGYACIPLGVDARINRGFLLKNLTEEKFYETVRKNLEDLYQILEYNLSQGILLFRISSDIIPFGSHPEMNFPWTERFDGELKKIGSFIHENGIRVSMHPGQYTVLNSPREDVVAKAVQDIEYHRMLLDAIGTGYDCKIVIHTGGVYKDKKAAVIRFQKNFALLSEAAQKRVVLENDERSFNILEVLDICRTLDIPAVFDFFHHQLNPPEQETVFGDLLEAIQSTWKKLDGRMKVHYSDGEKVQKKGAHGKTVMVEKFLDFYDRIKTISPDVMLEVKDKDISAIKVIYTLKDRVSTRERTQLWAKYKYTVMEKSYALYKECSRVINSARPMADFFLLVDQAHNLPYKPGAFINGAQHVWGYFKDRASEKERQEFFSLCENDPEPVKIKNFLKRMAVKYQEDYLLQSYYFIY